MDAPTLERMVMKGRAARLPEPIRRLAETNATVKAFVVAYVKGEVELTGCLAALVVALADQNRALLRRLEKP